MAFTMRLFVLAVLWLVTIAEAVSEPRDVVVEIQKTLAKRDDARRISDYIELSSKELKKALPLLKEDGTTLNCYTFFAPTSSAFLGTIPQDIGDPFYNDAEFRLVMLLRHFSQPCVTKAELKKKTTITMADSKSVKITQQGGSSKINDGDLVSEAIQLDGGFGNIFMIDRVFVTQEEVQAIIKKHPGPSIGFIPPQAPESKVKRQVLAGGYSEAKVDDDDVKMIALFAASQIAAKSNSGPLKVIKITSAATQVVAGTNYKLVFKLVDEATNDNPQSCEVVVFDQVWTKTRQLTSYTCNPDSTTAVKVKREELKVEGTAASDPQTKPEVLNIAGGYSSVPVDDPEIETVANWAASKIAAQSNSKSPVKVTKIKSAATQIVAGRNYKIVMELNDQTCEIVVFQSLKNDFELKKSVCNPEEAAKSAATRAIQQDYEAAPEPEPSSKPAKVSKRQIKNDQSDSTTEVVEKGTAGGFSSVPENNPEVEVVAKWAANKIAAKINLKEPVKVTKIKSAAIQVVAGRNYKIVMELDTLTCDVLVFQSLKNDFELKESSCNPAVGQATKPAAKQDPEPSKPSNRAARQIPGGYSNVKVDDDDIKDIANFAALQLASNTNSGPVSVIKIDSAAKQIVAGTNYKLTLHLEKKGVKTNEEDPLICQVIVFESLTKTRKLSESRCGPEIVNASSTITENITKQ